MLSVSTVIERTLFIKKKKQILSGLKIAVTNMTRLCFASTCVCGGGEN